MATAKQSGTSLFSIVLRIAAVLVIAIAAAMFFFGEQIRGYSDVGAAFAAKSVCSCRYVAERDMRSCKSDLPPDMWAVFLSDDTDNRAVTARVPLVTTELATYRPGSGCVLGSWSD